MVTLLLGLVVLYLTTSVVTVGENVVQINHKGEVVYQDTTVYGVVDKPVILECGTTVPDIYIWSFTKPGTEAIRAVVYNVGQGTRTQKLAETLGQPTVISNTSALRIETLPLAAHGLFTCQAFYDIGQEAKVYYYYVHLIVRVPVSKPYVLMSDAPPVEGSTMWMQCSVENGTEPILYMWQHETLSGNITTFAQGNSSIVNMTTVNRNHTGWYRCVASNAVNSKSSDRLWLDIIFGPDIPHIDISPYNITERDYSALETQTVSLQCQTQSNPASQYVWFYNSSQVYTGPKYIITNILRRHSGNYTCLAQNTYLNTSSTKTISLIVYYPPDGSPSCSVEPVLNHTSLRLLCSWPGGFPSPSLHWTGDLIHAGQSQTNTGQQNSSASSTASILLPSRGLTSNNSLFTCTGSHPALKRSIQCSTLTYIPPAEPVCFADVTNDQEYVMLFCSWKGGFPKVLVWWEGPAGQRKDGEEASNILILPYGTVHSGKPYTCQARHPLLAQTKTCSLALVPVSKPNILTSDASPVEGTAMWMLCNVENGTGPILYMWQHETLSGNITSFARGNSSVFNVTNVTRSHTGWYRCVASNAVNNESSNRLRLDTIFGPDIPHIDVTPYNITERGYSALETQTVSLQCQAQSNPASQYVWFYNSSQVYTGPKYNITNILRRHSGNYTCLAQNTYLNTSSTKTISLIVYYSPDGSPSCSVEPALNHTSLRLLCSWPGGFPSPSLHWTGDLIQAGQDQANTGQQTSSASSTASILLPFGGLTSNNSLFTCTGSHPALKQLTECSTRTYIPPAEPACVASVTNDRQYLMMSCSWEGGFPKALVWWEGPTGQGKGGEENSNTLILRYGTVHFGKPYTCRAKHPLLLQTKTCSLTLVPVSKPYILMSDVSPVEGSTMWMRCSVENGTGQIKYVWQRETSTGDVTTFAQGSVISVTNVNRNHTGWYRCVASNNINSETSDRLRLDTIFGPDVPQIDVTPQRTIKEGYFALETEAVSLQCQAQSNPDSQYVWFHNNSQVYTGQHYTITGVLRQHTGDYTCLAQNTKLNTRSKKTISMTVYYSPDGSPSCSVEPALNHTSLRLLCSWPGGFPSPSLQWTGDLIHAVQDQANTGQQTSSASSTASILLPSGGLTSDNSLFTCTGSHPALKQSTQCTTRTYIPPAEPVCFTYVTNDRQYLMLSCSWEGGVPKALVWWEGPAGQGKGGEENSNILILRYGTARGGKPYTCHAKHPLLLQTKTCNVTLEAPVLLTQSRIVKAYEGSDVQLTCSLRTNNLPVNEITWFNNQGVGVQDTSKYMLLRTSAWANLTVRDTDETQDSGEYRCSTSNAVGGSDINITLVVNKHPMPPNATLVRVMYISRQRNEVELEWVVENEEAGGWTGFFLERRWVSERPQRKGSSNDSSEQLKEKVGPTVWDRNIIQDPAVRIHTVGSLTPTVTYQFRIIPINHRTVGHPSAAKTPVEPPNNLYPAVIGAAVGGMIIAAILTVLLLVFILRNHSTNPRLHDLLFGLSNHGFTPGSFSPHLLSATSTASSQSSPPLETIKSQRQRHHQNYRLIVIDPRLSVVIHM